jgi:Flp pilus assembly protein TadG
MFTRITLIGRERNGGAAVEMALILPILVMMFFGIIELGRLAWAETVLHYAVANAARCRSIDTINCGTDALAQSYAANAAYFMSLTSANFTVATCTGGEQVSTNYTFTSTLFTLLPAVFTVSVKPVSCYPTP